MVELHKNTSMDWSENNFFHQTPQKWAEEVVWLNSAAYFCLKESSVLTKFQATISCGQRSDYLRHQNFISEKKETPQASRTASFVMQNDNISVCNLVQSRVSFTTRSKLHVLCLNYTASRAFWEWETKNKHYKAAISGKNHLEEWNHKYFLKSQVTWY